MESFFATLKKEFIHRKRYQSRSKARQSPFGSVETYPKADISRTNCRGISGEVRCDHRGVDPNSRSDRDYGTPSCGELH